MGLSNTKICLNHLSFVCILIAANHVHFPQPQELGVGSDSLCALESLEQMTVHPVVYGTAAEQLVGD